VGDVLRVAALVGALVGCGRSHFDAVPQATDVFVDHGIAIRAAGVFDGTAALRRTLATSTSRTTMTISTWYKSSDVGTLILDAGISAMQQTYLTSATTSSPAIGTPVLVHQETATFYGALPDYGTAPFPYAGQWVHFVCAVDLTQPLQADRARWWINGEPQVVIEGTRIPFPQDLEMYFGDTIDHTFGSKYDGGFPWTGSLAETYVIWGYALDASAFVSLPPEGLRSIAYTGPVTPESLYFDYAVPGQNQLSGQPDWTPTAVTTNTSDLPY
jgi:hypothetical protein